jgi:anti-anti-sigma factor
MTEGAPGRRARMTIVEQPDGGALLVQVAGELDIAGLPDVQPALDRLLAQDRQPVCIDAAGLEFMDSSGVAVLIRIANRFDTVELVHSTPAVRRVIQVLGLADRFGMDGP